MNRKAMLCRWSRFAIKRGSEAGSRSSPGQAAKAFNRSRAGSPFLDALVDGWWTADPR